MSACGPKTSPWGLCPAEVRALDLVLKYRGPKRAAQQTGIPLKSLETTLTRARKRMGAQFGDRLGYLLDWYEYRRGSDV